jgi:Fe-S cluster assembly ATPase SufC
MLSGGERNRLQLAQTLKLGGNLLLLDEPTNDLDVDTLRALEDALLAFAGCGTQFACFTGTKVQILTQEAGLSRRHQPRPLLPGPNSHAYSGV